MRLSPEVVLAKATGSTDGLGKVGTIPAAGVLYVRLDCNDDTQKVDWQVSADKAFTVQLYRARSVPQSVTLTLNGVLNTETLVINGLTYTGHTDTTTVATRTFRIDGDNDADAVALAGVINAAASGTLGITAVASAGGVVTLTPSTSGGAYVIQAVTGTAGAHCAVASTTLTNLIKHGSSTADATATGNGTTAGTFFEQWCDGWPYCVLGITNNAGADALTPVIKATMYRLS